MASHLAVAPAARIYDRDLSLLGRIGAVPEITEHVWDKLLHALEYRVSRLLFCRA